MNVICHSYVVEGWVGFSFVAISDVLRTTCSLSLSLVLLRTRLSVRLGRVCEPAITPLSRDHLCVSLLLLLFGRHAIIVLLVLPLQDLLTWKTSSHLESNLCLRNSDSCKIFKPQMDGLSSAASAIAVAIQLVDSVQKVSKFLKNVQGAPKEVLKLIETLDQLQSTLDNVRQLIETQFLVLRLPGSPTFIIKAIENCEEQIKVLEAFVNTARKSFERQSRLRKSWASMKVVSKKQDIEDIHCRLRDAKMDLQFALSSKSWHLR